MTAKEFWEEDPSLMWSYRCSYIMQAKNNKYRDNQLAYLIGIYNTSALSCTVGNMFLEKGKKPIEYMGIIDFEKIEKEEKMTEEDKKIEAKRKMDEELKSQLKELQKIISNKQGQEKE